MKDISKIEIAVIGLGYVGLPLAVEFGKKRSVVGFDIGSQIIKAVQSGILLKGGGHKMAGGFTLKKENIPKFRNFLIKNFEKIDVNPSRHINLYLDAIIAPSAINEQFFEEINCLAPFGAGNTEPKFVIENIKVISSKIVFFCNPRFF